MDVSMLMKGVVAVSVVSGWGSWVGVCVWDDKSVFENFTGSSRSYGGEEEWLFIRGGGFWDGRASVRGVKIERNVTRRRMNDLREHILLYFGRGVDLTEQRRWEERRRKFVR